MRITQRMTAASLASLLGIGLMTAPTAARASQEGRRNTAIGLGVAAAGLLLTQRNKTPGIIAGVAALAAASQIGGSDRNRRDRRYGYNDNYRDRDYRYGGNDRYDNRYERYDNRYDRYDNRYDRRDNRYDNRYNDSYYHRTNNRRDDDCDDRGRRRW